MKRVTGISLAVGFSILLTMPSASAQKAEASEADDNLANGLYAVIDTNRGKIVLRLHYKQTPLTVVNFVGLAEGTKGSNQQADVPFYDGLIFHRVVDGFVIQSGDPRGRGTGGPGYQFEDEFHPDLKHTGSGIVSMANSGPNTNGSQFFITHSAQPHLDGKHTVFGRVMQGQDVVDSISQGDEIQSITVLNKRDHEYKVDKL